jgi:hypothetical protein
MKRWAIFSLVLAHLLDAFTTMLPGGFESNSWARDAYRHPVLLHLVVVKLLYGVGYLGLGFVAYFQLRRWSQMMADILVTCWCLWWTADVFDAIIGNFVIYLGWVH